MEVTNNLIDNGAPNRETPEGSDLPELNVRSAEVQEIIGRPPHWLVRGGIAAFMIILLLVLLSAWFVEYPETIKVPLKLTAVNAPKMLESKVNGKLVNLISENDTVVEEGEILAWLETTASHEEVIELSARVDSMYHWLINDHLNKFRNVKLSRFSDLGGLQTQFQAFDQAWREFKSFLPDGFYHKKRRILEEEMEYNQQLLDKLRQQKEIQTKDFKLSQQEYAMKKRLSEKELVAPMELAQHESKLLNQRLPLQQTESAIINNHITQAAKEQELMELDRQISEQKSVFLQELNALKSAIDEWKSNYLISAPLSGKIIYASILQEKQTLQTGQELFYIQPENTQFFGQLRVSQRSFGKIKEGQQVLVRFSGYPDQEFGTVTGEINYLSDIPVRDSVFIGKVNFPQGLTTNYGQELPPRDAMMGQAEIITQDMRLLERFYNNISKQLQ
ncbi:HlyD family secretion protein [Aliifodinibius salicampi]|uniref:HlyD family secretion protein n=1 Tax=Fodinibius salicampi TaxID=1920655 RepID=A0ABT3PWL8_9BACT|nr:HlyD family efflux transporter periplasmic adaptor subunit [Fodinibius salicampi]MCW9712238.1 HlyD family secretion protein [Fodinibius salicampi]